MKRWRLRRNLLVLPAICLATVAVMVGVPELLAERAFHEEKVDRCLRPDPVLGHRAAPNCHTLYKPAEGPWTENDYNECGYRSRESCLTKAPDTFRVALIGSSTSMGYLVPYDETFAVRSAKTLSETCGHPVEFQSMGGLGYQWSRVEARMDEALTRQPDLVVATITPFDLSQPLDLDTTDQPPPRGRIAALVQSLRSMVQNSALWTAVLHYRADLPTTFLTFYLRDGPRRGSVQQPLSAFWQQQIGYTATLVSHLAAKARADNVPFLLVFVPLRSQPYLMRYHAQFPATDPLALDKAVGTIAAHYGVPYLDTTPFYAAADNLGSLFYNVEDHITGDGSALLAHVLSRYIVAARYPGLQSCSSLAAANATQ